MEGDGSDTEDIDSELLEGGRWERKRWWYMLAQVCQRWRHVIFASPSHLIYSFLRLYVWGTANKYACAFASYSASYSYHLHAFGTITGGPRRNSPRTQAPRSRAPHTPYDASARLIAATFVASQSTFRSDGTLKAAQRPLPPFARPMPSIQCLMIPAHNRK